MKVWQLIEALKRMPPEATVLAHADNHLHRESDCFRVAAGTCSYNGSPERSVVVLGNWSEYNLSAHGYGDGNMGGPKLEAPFFVTLSYGEHKGELRQERATFIPERDRELRTLTREPAHWTTEDEPLS